MLPPPAPPPAPAPAPPPCSEFKLNFIKNP